MTNRIVYKGVDYNINNNAQIPNFFLIGAPKCGTTALSEYLREHPEIYFSYPKESNFFNTDFSKKYRKIRNFEVYLNQCFYNSKGYNAVGEGTVWYLFSEIAIKNILEMNPKAKFIVMVRNPIEIAYSLHSTELKAVHENIEDFEKAWELQNERKNGKSIPPFCRESKTLQYGEVAKTGIQIQRLLKIVTQENVKIILFDDFINNTKKIYEDTLEFLQLKSDERQIFPKIRENKKNKSQFIELILTNLSRFFRIGMLKRKLGISPGKSILKSLSDLNSVSVERDRLSVLFIKKLQKYFTEDIRLLEKIIERDLSHWLK